MPLQRSPEEPNGILAKPSNSVPRSVPIVAAALSYSNHPTIVK